MPDPDSGAQRLPSLYTNVPLQYLSLVLSSLFLYVIVYGATIVSSPWDFAMTQTIEVPSPSQVRKDV